MIITKIVLTECRELDKKHGIKFTLCVLLMNLKFQINSKSSEHRLIFDEGDYNLKLKEQFKKNDKVKSQILNTKCMLSDKYVLY